MEIIDSVQFDEICNNIYKEMIKIKFDYEYTKVSDYVSEFLEREGYKKEQFWEWKCNENNKYNIRVLISNWRKVHNI